MVGTGFRCFYKNVVLSFLLFLCLSINSQALGQQLIWQVSDAFQFDTAGSWTTTSVNPNNPSAAPMYSISLATPESVIGNVDFRIQGLQADLGEFDEYFAVWFDGIQIISNAGSSNVSSFDSGVDLIGSGWDGNNYDGSALEDCSYVIYSFEVDSDILDPLITDGEIVIEFEPSAAVDEVCSDLQTGVAIDPPFTEPYLQAERWEPKREVEVQGLGSGSGLVSSTAGFDCNIASSVATIDCVEWLNDAQIHSLFAMPEAGSRFVEWQNCSPTNPTACSFSPNYDNGFAVGWSGNFLIFNNNFVLHDAGEVPYGPYIIKARFEWISIVIKGQGTGNGITTSSLGNINCETQSSVELIADDCKEMSGGAATATYTANAQVGSSFAGWDGSCEEAGGIVDGNTCVIPLSNVDVTLTPIYIIAPPVNLSVDSPDENSGYGLTTSMSQPIEGGEALDCFSEEGVEHPASDCDQTVVVGEQIVASAYAATGSYFEGWGTSCADVGGIVSGDDGGICTFTMGNEDGTLTPIYMLNAEPSEQVTLKIFGVGDGSVVGSVPSSIVCDIEDGINDGTCSEQAEVGSTVSLTATPALGFLFVGWEDCNNISETEDNVCEQFIVNEDALVTARFTESPTAELALTLKGQGEGAVSATNASFTVCLKPDEEEEVKCTTPFSAGLEYVFEAEASDGYEFNGFQGCTTADGSTCTRTLTFEDLVSGDAVQVEANFSPVDGIIGFVTDNSDTKDVPKLSEAEIAEIKGDTRKNVGTFLKAKNAKAAKRKARQAKAKRRAMRNARKNRASRLKLGSETYETALPINLVFGKNGDLFFDGNLQSIMGPRMDGSKLNLWTEGALSGFVGNKETKSGTLQVGADFQANKDMMFGLSTAYDWGKSRVGDTVAKSSSLTLSAYTDMKLGSGVNFNAGGSWTNSANKLAGSGEFDGETLQFDARLSGNQKIGGFTLSPALSASYVKSIQDAFTHQDGVFIASQSLSEGRIAVGPRVTYSASSIFKPWLGVNAAYTMTKENGLRSEVTSGQVEAGLNYMFTGGSSLNMSGSYDTDQKSKAAVKWSIPLN